MNYSETLDYLFKQLPMYQRQGKTAFKKDLTNTIQLCSILQNPQNKFKNVHIAGTNGKGSTAHMLASVFQEAGYKTGLYTSPHLKDFRERVRINGTPISEEEVIQFVENFQSQFNDISPSFFEWTVVLAFYSFAQHKVDMAIIETGLGGRIDSTNVISPELSVITNIGYDHVDLLGDTLEKIAGEKAGIIKSQIPVVVGDHSGVKRVFDEKADKENAPIVFGNDIDNEKNYKTDLLGSYQQQNAKTVFLAIRELNQLGYTISESHFQNGLLHVVKNTGLRGRWEILQEHPQIIAETAHNKEGLILALEQLKNVKTDDIHFVLGFVSDKEIDAILNLFPKEANYYFCQANVPRALDRIELRKKAGKIGLNGLDFSSVKTAITAAKAEAKAEDIIYIGGSNFVVAEAL